MQYDSSFDYNLTRSFREAIFSVGQANYKVTFFTLGTWEE